jgi:hypothetical protein
VEAKHARRAVNAGRHGGGAVSIRWTKCMRRAEEQTNFRANEYGSRFEYCDRGDDNGQTKRDAVVDEVEESQGRIEISG